MLGTLKKGEEHRQALRRVEAWTRERFSLQAEEVVTVAEISCSLPGCPPLETVVAFWTADGTRHHFKVFKPVQEVMPDDLPYYWMKEALAVPDGFICDCC